MRDHFDLVDNHITDMAGDLPQSGGFLGLLIQRTVPLSYQFAERKVPRLRRERIPNASEFDLRLRRRRCQSYPRPTRFHMGAKCPSVRQGGPALSIVGSVQPNDVPERLPELFQFLELSDLQGIGPVSGKPVSRVLQSPQSLYGLLMEILSRLTIRAPLC